MILEKMSRPEMRRLVFRIANGCMATGFIIRLFHPEQQWLDILSIGLVLISIPLNLWWVRQNYLDRQNG